ncbi:MAG: penicillin-binding protein [Propionibacteriaceae bacterium]|jgi:membrane peptidoglycan carboxypeptidase|nr:penicillin-binding protein [Propionibacteriaceae bacterium]
MVSGRPHRRQHKARSLFSFVCASVLAGLLIAGLFAPFAALAGVTSTAVSDSLEALPVELETPPDAARTTVHLNADRDGDGQLDQLAQFYDENRIVLDSIDQISPIMRQAQVDIEDERFFSHGPMDLRGTLRALFSNIGGGDTQGGSSLTQQYVKLVRVEAAVARDDQEAVAAVQAPTLARKLEEMRFAIAIEKRYPKEEILRRYLNIAYYGDGAYGVEAAAMHYFGVHASDLDLPQSAMLAGLVQNPNLDPRNYLEEALGRRSLVLDAMVRNGHITAEEAEAAKQVPFDDSQIRDTPTGCVGTEYPFICEYVYRSLLQMGEFGSTVDERERNIKRGGYEIFTTIDPRVQDLAQEAVSRYAAPTDPVIIGMSEVKPGTGEILAIAQSRPVMGNDSSVGETMYDYEVNQAMGDYNGFPAGSTWKPFTAIAAMDKGIPPTKTFNAQAKMTFNAPSFPDCDGTPGAASIVDTWSVVNASPSGVMNMYTATEQSVNTYYAQLVLTIGPCAAAKMAQAAGAEIAAGGNLVDSIYSGLPSITLGVVPTTTLSMATAYATFGARGKHCSPIIIREIHTQDGGSIPMPVPGEDNCQQTIRPEIADGVNRLLRGVVFSGLASRTRVDGRDQGGKTGTTETNDNVWTVAYTPEIAGAVHVSYDPGPEHAAFWDTRAHSVTNLTLPSGIYLAGTSSTTPAQIWKEAIGPLLADLPATAFTPPTDEVLRGKPIKVPSLSGTDKEVEARVKAAGFTTTQAETFDSQPAGTYLRTSCEPYIGGLCTMYYSKGPRDGEPSASASASPR